MSHFESLQAGELTDRLVESLNSMYQRLLDLEQDVETLSKERAECKKEIIALKGYLESIYKQNYEIVKEYGRKE